MGYMIAGTYHVGDDVTQTLSTGEWERSQSTVRNWITADGQAGPTGKGGFAAQPDRYHLYGAWNCPWAHRGLLVRALNGLQNMISLSMARPNRSDQGWIFDSDGPFSDGLLQVSALHEVYSRDPAGYTGRLTVPVLWDKKTNQIVSNESADILRMLCTAFGGIGGGELDLLPEQYLGQIDDWNALIYKSVNNGVYRAGFASTQEAYESAAHELFACLDKIDSHLSANRYLCGNKFTEADLRLFPTLVRFDVAYHYAFRCNLRRLMDYSCLWSYARDIFQMPGVADTVRFDIYKLGYFSASEKRNPLGIVPIGPSIDWTVPHDRITKSV